MRILAVTNMYPTARKPALGVFVEQQVKGLREGGASVEVMFLDRDLEGLGVYRGLGERTRYHLVTTNPDLVHVMYGGVMADLVTGAVRDRPTVVTFHGSDLLGENISGLGRKLISRYGVRASWESCTACFRHCHGVEGTEGFLAIANRPFKDQDHSQWH